MTARRDAWAAARPGIDPARRVFVDETWASTKMGRTHGRCPRGERLVMAVPHAHWKTVTFVAALRHDRLVAGRSLDGPLTGDRFVAWVTERLVPALRPGDIVVWDNVVCHKRAEARAAVEAAGAEVRFLPPYSPDLSPIEKAFSKVKAVLRTAAEGTVRGLRRRPGQVARKFRPRECRNYFASCGYAAAST